MTKMLPKLAPAAMLAALLLSACDDDKEQSAACRGPLTGATAELTYRIRTGDPAPRITPARLCERLRALGSGPVHVRTVGADRLRIVARNAEDARAAVNAAAGGASIHFYDWEANVLGPRGPDAPFAGGAALYDAVEVASTSKPPRNARDARARYYLFDSDRRPLAGERPARSCEELLAAYRSDSGSASYPGQSACRTQLEALGGGGPPSGSRAMRVPPGIAVIEAQRLPGQPPQLHRYFVIKENSEVSSADVENPRAVADAVTGDPVVAFDFTERGRRAFKRLTRRLARRGAKAAAGQPSPEPFFQRFAIVVDDRVVSLATIDFVASPTGIDAPRAQIAGTGSRDANRKLAKSLAAPPLEAELELVSIRKL
jgi:SecD/SecF fusion protein